MSVSLAGSLPDSDRNGLTAIAGSLIDDPENVHVVIAILDCTKITTKVESGEQVPTARIRAIEPIETGAESAELLRLLARTYAQRTGKAGLPFEGEA